jgi:large subunit ribosomal protein L23
MAIFSAKKDEKGASPKRREARGARLVPGAAHEVIRAPWLSEKALIGTERGVYVFAVAPRATAREIAGAIKELYGVSPKAVRLVNIPGKRKALRTRRGEGVRAARCKAYVHLNKGDTIALA